MKIVSIVALAMLAGGCGKGQQEVAPGPPREHLTVDSLGINVEKQLRPFMLSDKRGGFIVGTAGDSIPSLSDIVWSVQGEHVVTGLSVVVGTGASQPAGSWVYPHLVITYFKDGSAVTIAPLEISGAHAIVVQVRPAGDGPILLAPSVVAGSVSKVSGDTMVTWRTSGGNGLVSMYAGPAGKVQGEGIGVPGSRETRFLLVYEEAPAKQDIATIHSRVPLLQQNRVERMNRLLNRAYIKTSDPDLDKALNWTRLSLDALVVTLTYAGTGEHVAVAGLPWDGSLRGRDMAIAIPGLDFALNDYAPSAGILRWLATHQDTVRGRRTYGRIADRVSSGGMTFHGADVAPWFVRQMYEHVASSSDTTLVRELSQVVTRSIEGAIRYHVNESNLFTHGAGETWMDASQRGTPATPRGNCAAEMQLLWYFQQLIGGFVAQYAGDSLTARSLGQSATRTAESFNRVFVDTAHQLIFDHLLPSGKGVTEVRPNALFCVDILGSEVVRQSMLRSVVNGVVYPWGVGTLGQTDSGFKPYMGMEGKYTKEEAMHNGPVWTWLAGQLAYTLSRYDRQDLMYRMTGGMVNRLLTADMVGVLPEAYEAVPREGESIPRAAGLLASLGGMAEFVRSFYQDYLGIRVDAVSNQMWVQPKLPDEIRDVDFTISVADHPVYVRYVRDNETARVILDAPDIARPLKVIFLWIFMNGDAWRGSAMLQPGSRLTLIFGTEDLVAYSGEEVVELPSSRLLKRFSQRNEFTGVGFVGEK
jgi:glycogen debranching enzyme